MSLRRSVSATTTAFLLAGASAAAQGGLATWSVSPVPLVTIGGDGVNSTEFSRIAAAFRLSNGLIAVANGATKEIRLFDQQGRYLRAFGRAGAGPGEFKSLEWVGRSGDTAFFFDFSLKRITAVVLGNEPRPVRTTMLTATSDRGSVFVSGKMPDGRWLVQTPASPGWDGPPGVHRLPTSIGLVEANGGGAVAWLGTFDGMAVFVHNPTGNLKQATVGASAFTPWVYAVASGPLIWFGDSDADSLNLFSAANDKRTSVRLAIPRRRPTTAMIDSARERELALSRSDQGRAFTAAKFSAERLPENLPFFGTLVPGPGGEVWVQEYRQLGTEPARYLVIGPTGLSRAWVIVPPGVRVRDVGLDYVVATHEDDDGVETVRVYTLSRK